MTVITDDMVADIADAYLSLSPDTFEAWLRERAGCGEDNGYGLFLSMYLADMIRDVDAWAREHARKQL